MHSHLNQDHPLSIIYFYVSLWAAWGITNHGNFTFYSWLSQIVNTFVCHTVAYMLVHGSMVCFDQWNVSKSMQNKIILCCKLQHACATSITGPWWRGFCLQVFDENDKKVVLYNAFFHQCIRIKITILYVNNVIQNLCLSSTS